MICIHFNKSKISSNALCSPHIKHTVSLCLLQLYYARMSSFFKRLHFFCHEGQTWIEALDKEQKRVCRRKFYSCKFTLILEPAHLRWQSAICGRCTKRSRLSMYFCMRDWVRTWQFNWRFRRNTSRMNHRRSLRDSAAAGCFMWRPGHVSLS